MNGQIFVLLNDHFRKFKDFLGIKNLNCFIILQLGKVKLRIVVRMDKVNHKYLKEEIFIVNTVKLPNDKQQCLLGN